MIRVRLPTQLREFAALPAEISLADDVAPTQRGILDAIEETYPPLRGTLRDPLTTRRRPFLRFYVCGEDLSFDDPDDPLPSAVACGKEPFVVIGAISGG